MGLYAENLLKIKTFIFS